MPEVIGSKAHGDVGVSNESFGPWVDNSQSDAQTRTGAKPPANSAAPISKASADAEIAAMRSYRAGTGPLGSLACLPCASGASPRPASAKSADNAEVTDGSVFTMPTKAVAFALSSLMALGIVAVYCVRQDVREIGRFAELARIEHNIADHNHTRNLLITPLARDRDGKLANLRDHAEVLDGFQQRPQAVVIFTPDGKPGKPEAQVLPELRRRIERDLKNIEGWTPPPLLQDHHDMRFAMADLKASRLPLNGMLALVVVAMVIWSSLVMRNLPALRAPAGCFRPSRVPLCWLAPVANLYLPCAIMRDIWYGSEPTGLTYPEGLRLPVIGLWWLTFLGAIGMSGYAIYRMVTAVGVFMIGQAWKWSLYADVTILAMTASTFVIVAAASWNQSRRMAMVETMEAQLGPRRAWRKK